MPKRGKYKMFDYGRTRRQRVNYTISYRAAHAASVRYSWVLQDQNLSELILLYNTVQFKKAADTYECDSLFAYSFTTFIGSPLTNV